MSEQSEHFSLNAWIRTVVLTAPCTTGYGILYQAVIFFDNGMETLLQQCIVRIQANDPNLIKTLIRHNAARSETNALLTNRL